MPDLKFNVYKRGSKTNYQSQIEPPVGSIVAFPVATAPSGWLLCQGQEISRTTYSALDGVIGTTYGAYTNGSGNAGTSHFRLPDLQSRIPVGSGTGSGLSSKTIGNTGGATTVTLTAAQTGIKGHEHAVTETAHTHSVNNDQHRHGVGHNAGNSIQVGNIAGNATAFDFGSASANANQLSQAVSVPTGGWYSIAAATTGMTLSSVNSAAASQSHTNIQPSIVMAYIIKV